MNLANPLMVIGLAALPVAATKLDGDGAQGAAPTEKQDVPALIQTLGDKDYKARKEAFRALEKMGAKARAELEKAQKSDDAEVRWSASLLLDRLDEDEADGAIGRLRARADGRDQGADEPADPSLAPMARRWRALRTPEDAMQDMREAMRRLEDWQKQFEGGNGNGNPGWFHGSPFGLRLFDDPFHGSDFGQGQGGLFGRGGGLELGPGSSFSRVMENDGKRESLSIKVDENGRVAVEQEKDGATTKYEANSLEALKKDHPGLLELRSLGAAPQDDSQPSKEARPKAGKRSLEKPLAPRNARVAEPPASRPRLGVQVAPLSADVTKYLELDAGVGLEVVEVVPGSAAEKLGIKARDVITEVNGQTIRGVDDVSKALGDKDPMQAEVTVVRRGEEKTLDDRK